MLNTTQLQTLKAYIAADPVLSLEPMNGDGDYNIAKALNQIVAPAFQVWSSNVRTQDIFDAIIWANLTPAQTVDGTQAWLNRTMLCQSKQFNLQTILTGRETIDATKVSIRNGIQDALTGLPSKTDGTTQGAGWAAVQLILQRTATVAEKIFATGTGTTASPATVVITNISSGDVNSARNS